MKTIPSLFRKTFSTVMAFVLTIVLYFPVGAQTMSDTLNENLSQSRNRNIRHQLDYRFRGGSGSFERLFYSMVEYTPEARRQCVVGTTIMSFTVDCDGNLGDFSLKNPLHFGLNEKLQEFFKASAGQWNICDDQRYTRFEIPVLFTVAGTETAARGFVVVEAEVPGFKCKSDQYYFSEYEKQKKKGRTRQALNALDQLIRRDPYNQQWFELKRQMLVNEPQTAE
ncbi:MAG TPA: hypothetical protein PKE03_09075 [Bacteroidales bacterium]|nr:hypothetical protein [Bacteroidales bacterium]